MACSRGIPCVRPRNKVTTYEHIKQYRPEYLMNQKSIGKADIYRGAFKCPTE
jgi:hypothetical protein